MINMVNNFVVSATVTSKKNDFNHFKSFLRNTPQIIINKIVIFRNFFNFRKTLKIGVFQKISELNLKATKHYCLNNTRLEEKPQKSGILPFSPKSSANISRRRAWFFVLKMPASQPLPPKENALFKRILVTKLIIC